jgi:hypothetical protein
MRPGKDAQLSPAEVANLPQFLAANGLLRPIAEAGLPPALAALAGLGGLGGLGDLAGLAGLAGAASSASAAPAAPQQDLAALREELAVLQAAMRVQAAEIEGLKHGNAPAGAGTAAPRGKRKPRHE